MSKPHVIKWCEGETVRRTALRPGLQDHDSLNLGCGIKHDPRAINLDVDPETFPDVLHNLNCFPWPFPDNYFREVLAFDVIEHLDSFIPTMQEIHRICRDGAVVRITVPHYSCVNAFTDPTHRSFFGYFSMDYLMDGNEVPVYTQSRFKKIRTRLFFFPSVLNKLVWRFASRYPQAYERRWAWIFPAWYLYFELQVEKSP